MDDARGSAGWHRLAVEVGGIQRYAQVIRRHLGTIALTVLLTLLGGGPTSRSQTMSTKPR